ncbi:unnamed protein product [Rotaria sordida]|uniref:Multidrug and toxin extrusion protein n=1 Tax=Rotaria sordida TaxID=392033 RepID=A0A814GJ62_9BILA|nr:unnamed protein product [Rotaria sordida]CAF0997033.1 unnamed protein product [Rotaria sordida]CAF1188346.1 unnamed protein product [Rotaria sordida]CAF3705178.1 unnamed protein product [Rotaria sordida]
MTQITCNKNLIDKTSNKIDEDSLTNNAPSQTVEILIQKPSTSLIQRCFPFGFRDEALILIKITFPFALGNVLASWLISFVSLAFVGHARGQIELNACALALSTYILIANSLMLGLNFGCDTLLPQCFGGNKRKMGLTIQRAVIITGYSCLVSWTLMLNVKYVLKLIEHDQQVVRLADTFLRSFLVAVPFDGLSMLLQKYIASNEKTWPLLIINLLGNGVNVILNYLFLYKFHWDMRSVPISITISYAIIAVCAFFYIRFSSIYKETWYPINRACLNEWKTYLKLSAPGILMIMTEFWSIELSIYFAAYLSIRSLSAQVCAYQTAWLFYLVTSSFATAANIRIGQFLGSGKPMEAANTKNVTYTVGAIIILINICLITLFHYWFPFAYNTHPDALTLARRVLLLIALLQIWDGYNVINTGIVKACGKQKCGAIIAFIGFYAFGIPLAGLLMFVVRMDIYGFWIGIIVAETVTNTFLFLFIQRFNWERHTKAALIRIDFNPNDVAAISIVHEKSEEINLDSKNDTDKNSTMKSIGIKIFILLLLILFLITGIITSTWIPL